MQIKNNFISNELVKINKIPHHICNMNQEERLLQINKIKKYIKELKIKIEKCPKDKKEKTDPNFLNLSLPVFMLAYYGFSIKSILEDLVFIYKDIFQDYIDEINNKFYCSFPYKKPYKKILFCSSRLGKSTTSVYKSTYEIINYLSSLPDFHVDLMTCFPLEENAQKSYQNCKNILKISSLENNINLIGGGRYDAIIYPDMNMDASTSCIGFFRLAPYQITTFGHSETSGLADYFITSKFYETSTPDENYTEKVISFNSLALKYKKIEIENYKKDFKPRYFFQIPENSNVYYCNSSFFKMGSEMFEIFKGILDSDPLAIICLTKLNIEYWDGIFFQSLDHHLELKYKNRIKFIQRLDYLQNLNFLSISDVFIESYPFGNMNSTLEAFSVGLPVISMPTTKLNGRFTYGFYKKIGLEKDYCVFSIKDYISKAVTVACEKNSNKRNDLIEKSKVLFEEQESVIEWENFLRNLE
jgi:predicted O-linked N-acetylglucosamine transferase (SPINDLY family)